MKREARRDQQGDLFPKTDSSCSGFVAGEAYDSYDTAIGGKQLKGRQANELRDVSGGKASNGY